MSVPRRRLTITVLAARKGTANTRFDPAAHHGRSLIEFQAGYGPDGVTVTHYVASGSFTAEQEAVIRAQLQRNAWVEGIDYSIDTDDEPQEAMRRRALVAERKDAAK